MPDLDCDDLWGDSSLDDSKELPHGDIKSEFHRYPLLPAIYEELDAFLKKKAAYLADKSLESKGYLYQTYELVSTSIKHEMHAGRISEGDFLHLKALLQEETFGNL